MPFDLPLVVSSGVCVGCGACAVAAPDRIEMRMSPEGSYLPYSRDGGELDELDDAALSAGSRVCPFAGDVSDEDEIGARLFANEDSAHHDAIGHHRKIVAGHVATDDFRELGTSGGMTSWIMTQLLQRGEVDAVVHVASTLEGLPNPLSRYVISRTVEDLLDGRKSRYHVQTLAEVLKEVRDVPGRYAVIGVPCFIKAVRLLQDQDTTIDDRVVFTASLFCGHMKSSLYSQYLAWSVGLEQHNVKDIDYRHKEPGRPPNRYCANVRPFEGQDVIRGAERIPMADWGIGIFKLGACDYCDDIVGETADVSVGDAWMPPFMSDWRGANVAVARSALAAEIISHGEENNDLDVIPWTADEVAASQAGAVRHRRPGLAVRLGNKARLGQWAPRKRVAPAPESELTTPFAIRMLNREAIAVASAPAFLRAKKRRDLQVFLDEMRPLIRRYDGSRSSTLWRRTATWLVLRSPSWVESLLRRLARLLHLK